MQKAKTQTLDLDADAVPEEAVETSVNEEVMSFISDDFEEQKEKLMLLLASCDEGIDYKEMDDQLESMRKKIAKKKQQKTGSRSVRKEHVDNLAINAEYKAKMYYNKIKKELE